MKRLTIVGLVLVFSSLLPLANRISKWDELRDNQTAFQNQIWVTGQLNLVVERTFSLAAMAHLSGDRAAGAEAVNLLDQTLSRIQSPPLLQLNLGKEIAVGLLWLRAMLNDSPQQSSAAFRLKAFRDVVVESQKQLGLIHETILANQAKTYESIEQVVKTIFAILTFDFVLLFLMLSIALRRRFAQDHPAESLVESQSSAA